MTVRLLSVLLILVGCEGGEHTPDRAATTNQIERLSTPGEEKQDPFAAVRLQPLDTRDLDREGMLGAGCTFLVGDELLLAATGSGAVVKLRGEVRHLVAGAEVGPTGGFFEDRHLSVSVGRTSEAGTRVVEGMAWPGRMTVTNRRAEVEQARAGMWACGA